MIDDLPFMAELRACFNSQQSNQFLLTGNVFDLFRCPWLSTPASAIYLPLQDYLVRRLGLHDRLVIVYNIATGIEFQELPPDAPTYSLTRKSRQGSTRPTQKVARQNRARALACYKALFDPAGQRLAESSFQEAINKSSAMILPSLVLLRKICQGASQAGILVAIVLEHCESLLPDRPAAQMSDVERQRLILLKEWLTDETFVTSSHLIVAVAETSSAVHAELRSLPHMRALHLPLPDVSERFNFLQQCLADDDALSLEGTDREFADLAAGMTLLGIQQVLRAGSYQSGAVGRADFVQHLNHMLESRLGDYIELVRPSHSMAEVVGNTALKTHLERVRKTLRSGDPDIAPVGLLVSGPNGVGKTYVMLAWANACERVVLILKNLRGSLFGQTDQIFEQIRNVLEVLGNVMILVDEADTMFARPGNQTHETEQRLFGNVIKMMGDPRNRGRIVWVLMTARPDALAPDFKRPGRCGLHLPIFDPEGEDRAAFMTFILDRCGLDADAFESSQRTAFEEAMARFSPADFREFSGELRAEQAIRGQVLEPAAVLRLLAEYQPGALARDRRIQTLQAVLHCSKRSLLPPSLQDFDRSAAERELATLTLSQ